MSANPTAPPSAPRASRYRWVICALLFFATTINYMDRQVLGILAPTLQKEIGWNEIDYGNIVVAFQAAYALGLLLAGVFMDRFGTRLGYAIAICAWSLAAMSHAAAHSVAGFATARFALGVGEAGNFPAAIKTVAEWFPKRERALATGIFNAGSNVGAILAPLTVPFIALNWGWQWAFIALGAVGFLWLVFWLPLYRRPETHPRVSAAELAHINSDPPEDTAKVPWRQLLGHRQLWAFAVGKFLTDTVWWFYLYWTPKFLDKQFHISLSKLGAPLVVVYCVADIGSIGGGWLSGRLIKRGWSVNAGRKTAMLVCALCVTPVVFSAWVTEMWAAVALVSLAAAAHQGWSANLFTTASDMFPRRAVGSVVGIGGMAGAAGGIIFSSAAGHVLEWTGGNYAPIFAVCGATYLVALAIVHALAPKLEPAKL
ncbi:MAG: MFS transporter [Verrucomicrobia bacterium]|nr:MFS transporter [Verrucomicrobiota bacterium]